MACFCTQSSSNSLKFLHCQNLNNKHEPLPMQGSILEGRSTRACQRQWCSCRNRPAGRKLPPGTSVPRASCGRTSARSPSAAGSTGAASPSPCNTPHSVNGMLFIRHNNTLQMFRIRYLLVLAANCHCIFKQTESTDVWNDWQINSDHNNLQRDYGNISFLFACHRLSVLFSMFSCVWICIVIMLCFQIGNKLYLFINKKKMLEFLLILKCAHLNNTTWST